MEVYDKFNLRHVPLDFILFAPNALNGNFGYVGINRKRSRRHEADGYYLDDLI